MAAFGLYTHIQSNKRRSIALLLGLFFLVYVMTFAGALLAEGFLNNDPNPQIGVLLHRAFRDLLYALPWATGGSLLCGTGGSACHSEQSAIPIAPNNQGAKK